MLFGSSFFVLSNDRSNTANSANRVLFENLGDVIVLFTYDII